MFSSIPFYIYLTDVIPSIGCALAIMSVALGAALLLCTVLGGLETISNARYGENDRDFLRGKVLLTYAKKLRPWFFIVLILAVISPSRNTMYMMGAGAAVQIAAENPQVQSVAYNSMKLLENKMAELVAEQEKSNKK